MKREYVSPISNDGEEKPEEVKATILIKEQFLL